MSDSPQQHDQELSNDTTTVEGERTEQQARLGEEGEEQATRTEGIVEQSPNVSEEKKADSDLSTKQATEIAAEDTAKGEEKADGTEPGTAGQDEPQEVVEDNANHPEITNNPIETGTQPTETEQHPTSSEPVANNVSADPSPAISLTALRPLSPSSRTSTPPLTATSTAPAAKKFSAINVNKKFLSKTGSPSPSGSAVATKLNPLASRPISSPVPIAAPSSRLLSTTLTTVSSKPSVSSQPPSSASTSSPWAKPAVLAPDSSLSGLHQQTAYKRGTPLTSTGPMGQGQGISSSKPAWRAVNSDGKRGPAMGMSRDFPTASEVAEGKRAAASSAQAHAEAQAAQAEALMQGLNAFTHLEPNAHRWDDDDDEDDIIDFGDGGGKAAQGSLVATSLSRPERPTDQPVTKSERFVEDFDRSWPRSAQAPVAERIPPPELRKRESDRVLFNAASNRLEPPSSRPAPPQQPSQPTKLMSRPEAAPADRPIPGRASSSRQLPPHLANGPEKGRAPPPHLAAVPDKPQTQESGPGRTAWGANRDQGRQAPPHLSTRPELPPRSAVFDDSQASHRPSGGSSGRRQSFATGISSNQPMPSDNRPKPVTAPAPSEDLGDAQAAEMHTAAEKARLRRQAEEEERRAAADRAKQKARELEIKYGAKPAKPAEPTITAEPPVPVPAPSYTIAQRPRPQAEVSRTSAPSGPASHPTSGPAGLPNRPRPSIGESSRPRDDLWRGKPEAPKSTTHHPPPQSQDAASQQARPVPTRNRPARATAESFFEKPRQPQPAPAAEEEEIPVSVAPVFHVPGMPLIPRNNGHEQTVKKDEQIDDMLARIKAAMVDRPEETPSTSGQSATSKPAPPAAPLEPVSAFFDITEPEVPRSPPPAWRTYTVRLPKDCKNVPELSHSQRLALSRTIPPPRGWLMSYNPPLDLHPNSLSVPELLLSSYDNKSHFHRHQKPAPLVNIPQGSYEPYVKGSRASSSAYHGRSAEQAPTVPVEERRDRRIPQAAPSRAGLADRWRIQEAVPAVAPEPAVTQKTIDLLDTPPPPRKARSPVKAPTRSGGPNRFEKMAIGTDGDSSEIDLKSGVRFMVSSELEGDSLLEEVNKMSLDTVEETEMGAPANVASQDNSQSPSIHQTTASSRTHPSSPNGLPPWSNQREHLKHVWEQSAGPASEAKGASITPVGSDSTPASTYSSGNPSASSDPATAQPAHPSQAFSPTSAVFPGRHSAGPSYMNPSENLSGMSYSSTPKHASSAANGYPANGYAGMSQQGLWSAPAFGSSVASPGYGYAKSGNNALEQKTAMAFNSAGGSKESPQYVYNTIPSPQHYARAPYGSYTPPYTVQQQQMHQQQQQHRQRVASSSTGAYGYTGYTNAAPHHGTQGGSMSGRFQSNGSGGEEYGGSNGQDGQYYGTSAGHAGQASHNGYYASGTGGVVDGAAGSSGQGSHQSGGTRRKMW